MSPVAVSLQQILDLASHYSPRSTPDMRKRAEIGNDLAAELGNVLPGLTVSLGLTDLGLRTEPGGRQGSFSPIPWVRVYSPDYAPSAQAGIYLVYLFAADGSRAYLSLMPGTSEFRSGQMRAITDTRVLLARGGEGRSALGDRSNPQVPPGLPCLSTWGRRVCAPMIPGSGPAPTSLPLSWPESTYRERFPTTASWSQTLLACCLCWLTFMAGTSRQALEVSSRQAPSTGMASRLGCGPWRDKGS